MALLDKFVITATAKSIRRKHVLLKTSSVILMISVLLLLMFYGFASFANTIGTFTIKINNTDGERAISLSNTSTFEQPTTYIEADALDGMDNITESWLPTDIDEIDGAHNGENYIAHTFYLKNVGTLDINYQADIKIVDVQKEADEAIRVRVYKNGEAVTYAKLQNDQLTPEPGTTPFYSNTMVMNQVNEEFVPGDIDKYTIVIWLEGNDPECVDAIKGGQVRMVMNFGVIHE